MNNGFRRLSVAFVRMLLGVMLLAQVVNAGQACVMPPSPVMAFANADHDSDCAKRVNPNSCLQQSIAADQSFGQAELPVLAMPDVAVLTLPREVVATASFVITTAVPHRSTDPPPSIRFCSFQI
jgi:hypothetical protein